jgi:hypothetical protein
MKQDQCPECGKHRVDWHENNRQGCPGDDGDIYCSQLCAGKIRRVEPRMTLAESEA